MSTLGSNLSDGLSLKAPPGYPHDYSVNSSQTASSKLGYNYANANEDGDGLTRSCCFGKCETSPNNCTQQFCGCDDSADRNNNCSCLFRCCSFKKRSDCGFCAVLSLLLTCLFIGVIGPLAMNSLIDSEINSELVIDSTSAPAYKVWQTNAEGEGTKTKIAFDLYFFNFTNVPELLAGEKPVVVEKGPYAYNEYFYKFDIEWSHGGDQITYNNQRYFVFDQSRTGEGLYQVCLYVYCLLWTLFCLGLILTVFVLLLVFIERQTRIALCLSDRPSVRASKDICQHNGND
jgi:hypothetical protein